ncbi:hypothetical protein AB4144_53575, partial [Rhizobiaceae sp. 2RAB30]
PVRAGDHLQMVGFSLSTGHGNSNSFRRRKNLGTMTAREARLCFVSFARATRILATGATNKPIVGRHETFRPRKT